MSSKDSSVCKETAKRIQPGRLMVTARSHNLNENIVSDLASAYGAVRSVHRSNKNKQLLFIQFEDNNSAERAIIPLRATQVFSCVDYALLSERFSQGENGDQFENTEPQFKGKFKPNTNQKQSKVKHTFGMGNGSRQSENDFQDQDAEEVQKPQITLGCWFCSSMPNFECQCGAYYCNQICQRSDWPKHKALCMPRLLPISYSNRCIIEQASKQISSMIANSVRGSNASQQRQQFGENGTKQQQRKQSNEAGYQQRSKQQSTEEGKQQKPYQRKQPAEIDNKRPKPDKDESQERAIKKSDESPDKLDTASAVSAFRRMKLAQSAKNKAVRILEGGPFPPEGVLVKLSATLDSGVVYIYDCRYLNNQPCPYDQLTKKMFTAAETAKPLKQVPAVDDVIFAPFQDQYYRAKVISVDGDKLEVHFSDFGNTDTVSWQESAEIADEELKWAKYHTFPFRLQGVGTLSAGMRRILDEIVDTYEMVLLESYHETEDDTLRDIVLRRQGWKRSINEQLIELREKEKQERKERAEQKDPKIKIPNPDTYRPVLFQKIGLSFKPFPKDNPQRLLIVDAGELLEFDSIGVLARDDIESYVQDMAQLVEYATADPNHYYPTEDDEVCLVKHDEDWSRAHYNKGQDLFMSLDIGFDVEIPKDRIRRYPVDSSKFVYKHDVVVKNPDTLKEAMTKNDPNSLHGRMFLANVESTEGGLDTITIVNEVLSG